MEEGPPLRSGADRRCPSQRLPQVFPRARDSSSTHSFQLCPISLAGAPLPPPSPLVAPTLSSHRQSLWDQEARGAPTPWALLPAQAGPSWAVRSAQVRPGPGAPAD